MFLFLIKKIKTLTFNKIWSIFQEPLNNHETIKINHNYVMFLTINHYNLHNFNDQQKNQLIQIITNSFKLIEKHNININIVKLTQPLNWQDQIDYIQQLIVTNQDYKHLLMLELAKYQNLTTTLTEPLISIILTSPDQKNLKIAFEEHKALLNNHDLPLFPKILAAPETIKILLNFYNVTDLNVKITSKFNCLKINTTYYKFFTIEDYPVHISPQWLSKYESLANLNYYMSWHTINKLNFQKQVTKAINNLATDTTDKLINQHHSLQTNFEKIINEVATTNQEIYATNLFFVIKADNKKQLKQTFTQITNQLQLQNFMINELFFEQSTALKQCLQWNQPRPLFYNYHHQEILSTTWFAFWPFAYEKYQDKQGLILGINQQNQSHIIFNPDLLNQQRINHNIVILGKSGSGKTIAAKKIIKQAVLNQNKIIIIDPEQEYRNIVTSLKGDIIDFQNKNIYINPFEIYFDNHLKLDNHIAFLQIWFNILFPFLNKTKLDVLTTFLYQMYKDKEIDNFSELAYLTSADFPVLQDLYNCLVCEATKINLELAELFKPLLTKTSYFNCHTNLNLQKSITLFDISSLQTSYNNSFSKALLFLIFYYVEKEVLKNRLANQLNQQSHYIYIVIDEAHVLINQFADNYHYQPLNFIFNLTKRIRKYQGGTIIISQNIKDFVNISHSFKTESILNNAQTMLVFNLNDGDVNNFDTLLKKSIKNQLVISQINQLHRGECLLIASDNIMNKVKITVDQYEKDLF